MLADVRLGFLLCLKAGGGGDSQDHDEPGRRHKKEKKEKKDRKEKKEKKDRKKKEKKEPKDKKDKKDRKKDAGSGDESSDSSDSDSGDDKRESFQAGLWDEKAGETPARPAEVVPVVPREGNPEEQNPELTRDDWMMSPFLDSLTTSGEREKKSKKPAAVRGTLDFLI